DASCSLHRFNQERPAWKKCSMPNSCACRTRIYGGQSLSHYRTPWGLCHMNELLTPAEMAEADRLAGLSIGGTYGLMLRAGEVLARELLQRYAQAPAFDVLCGPGNNGGDGYVLAAILHDH